MSIQTFGMAVFHQAVARGMELAALAEAYVRESQPLELWPPESLGIVCFRINPTQSDLEESALEDVGGEFVGIRHRSIFGSREPGVPREVVAMA